MRRAKKIVVDSSVAVKWLTGQNELNLAQVDKLLEDCSAGKVELLAPELSKYEIGNAILYKGMNLPAAKTSLATLYVLPIKFIPLSEDLALQTLEIAEKHKMTYYDASFVGLAKQTEAFLVTDNPKHQKNLEGLRVIQIKDY